jgi:hypothetical protein
VNTSLVHVELPLEEAPDPLTQAQAMSQAQDVLRQMVLDTVPSVNSKRNYAKALDDLFVFCASRPLSRALLMEYRTTLQKGQLIALEGTLRYREYEEDVHGLTVRHRIRFFWFVSAGCGTCLPGGCAVATASQGD